jgi:hypothetical protein
MDNSLRSEQGSTIQQSNSFLIRSLMILDCIEKWLAGFFEMTEEEKKDAGVYSPDEQHNQ